MTDKKVKKTKFTVEILENGFTTEVYGYNPYGSNAEGKSIRATAQEVVTEFFGVIAENEMIKAEELKKKEANNE